jgi:hypothetical protein
MKMNVKICDGFSISGKKIRDSSGIRSYNHPPSSSARPNMSWIPLGCWNYRSRYLTRPQQDKISVAASCPRKAACVSRDVTPRCASLKCLLCLWDIPPVFHKRSKQTVTEQPVKHPRASRTLLEDSRLVPILFSHARCFLSPIHTYVHCTQTRFCVQSLGMSADCPRTVRRQIICTRAVSVVCLLGCRTTDKVCRCGRVRIQSAYACLFQCVSLLLEFELLTCGRTSAFLPLLRIYSPVSAYGLCTVPTAKLVIKKVMQMIFLQTIWNQHY